MPYSNSNAAELYNQNMSVLAVAEDVLQKYEPVIGLEVHVQLGTETKIFCGCPMGFGAPPNTNVCPVCLGLPGALPVLSRQAVELAIRRRWRCTAGEPVLALRAQELLLPGSAEGLPDLAVRPAAGRARLSSTSWWTATRSASASRASTWKTMPARASTTASRIPTATRYVDLNRSGTPLIEIVSEPDMRSSDEAYAYLTELKQVLQYIDVSDCDMEKGHLRCDANVSVRLKGAEKFGTKAEVKNLNSFRFLKMALDYRDRRQVALIEGGGRVVQETRLYNLGSGRDRSACAARKHAHDYRYFPEPDLVPLRVSEHWLHQVASALPELPQDRRERFMNEFGLREYDAEVLTLTRATSDYFEEAVKV